MNDYLWGAPSRHTRLVFERALAELPFRDGQDWADARSGWLAELPAALRADPPPLADLSADVLHPSLQRMRDLRAINGLFRVVPGVWQIRDGWRNVTVVAGERGRILLDPPHSSERTASLVRFLDDALGADPVSAVLHSTCSAAANVGTSVVDGVTIEALPVGGSDEAGEVLRWFPDHGMLHASTVLSHSLPALLVDGRPVDPLSRAKALDRALLSFRADLTVLIGCQGWPTWGSARVRQLVADARDTLRFLHDEVLRLAAAGAAPDEVVAVLELPPTLSVKWPLREYDATLEDYACAVFPDDVGEATQPERRPLSAAAEARLVRALGGGAQAVGLLGSAVDDGDYETATELGELLLRVEPSAVVGAVTGQAYEQRAFQQENLLRRQRLLARAHRLARATVEPARDRLAQPCRADAESDALFDLLAVRLDGSSASGEAYGLRWQVSGVGHLLTLRNGVLFASPNETIDADAEIRSSRDLLGAIACGHRDGSQAIREDALSVTGDARLVDRFFAMLDPWSCANADAMEVRP